MMAKKFQDVSSDELLSAFMDGENEGDTGAFVADISSNENLKGAWQRYHLARDVMQRDYTPTLSADFAVNLSRKLDMEGLPEMTGHTESNVLPMAETRSQRSIKRRTWLPAAGLAMAASAAAVFVGVNFNETGSEQGTSQINTVAQLQQQVKEVAPVVLSRGAVVPALLLADSGTRWRGSDEAPRNTLVEQRLNSLLTNHLEDAAMGKVHGMLAHSRVVSYDSVSGTNDSF